MSILICRILDYRDGGLTVSHSAGDYWSPPLQSRLDSLSHLSSAVPAGDLDALKAFDDEVAYLRIAICTINARRNHTTPICRLPSEILAHIFSFLVAVDFPQRQNLGWIKVSHVCSYWREVALEYPQLWTRIQLDLGKAWVLEMSTRAKQASLIFESYYFERSVRLISPHWPRAGVVILSGLVTPVRDLQPIDIPAPMMEHFELSVGNRYDLIMKLSDDLFSKHAPLLRTASFDGLAIPWSSPVFHNLISLKVHGVVRSKIPSYDNFFDALSNMPYLETLSISETLPPLHASSSGRPQKTVALSHLSSLSLSGTWSRCMAFLEIVEFPPLATMTLCCNCDEGLFRRSLLPVLERQSGKMGLAPPLRTIQMNRYNASLWIYFSGWAHCNPYHSHDSSKTPPAPFSLKLLYESRQPLFDCDILEALLTPETVILSLAADLPWDLAMFRRAIEHAQGVKHISLSESTLPLFCAAMDTDTTAAEQTPANLFGGHLLFPSLESIDLRHLQLSHTSTLDLLTSVLKQRSTSRSPIQKVEIVESDIPDTWVDELRTIVPIVSCV